MACGSCGISKDGKPGGCNGNCSGGCNRMNTFDWLAQLDIQDTDGYDLVEISFKNGSRKEFFHNPPYCSTSTGDWVLVEVPGGGGFDVGKISLMGDLVKMQLKKKGIKDSALFLNVIRRANPRDLEKLDEVRATERDMMIKARAISRMLDLDMKVGDVEFQGDGRKMTFFYTADGRVDFRELIRLYAKEFKVKIEMRQIGARQESSRVGGIGSCGRELCCSTWLSDFKSVSTAAARYQQLAINQAKLSGMCGRLKCCLNYELDTYLDALEDFPPHPERLATKAGRAELIKTDVFRGLMTYVMTEGPERGKFTMLAVQEVKSVLAMNKRGEMPPDLKELQFVPQAAKIHIEGEDDYEDDDEVDYGGDLVGAIELTDDKRKKKKKKKKKPFENKVGEQRPPQEGVNRDRPRDASKDRPNTPRPPRSNEGNPPRPPRSNEPRPPRPPQNNADGTPRNNEPRPPRPPQNNADGTPRNNEPRPPRPPQNNADGTPRNNEPRPPRPPQNNADGTPRNNEPRPPRPPRPPQSTGDNTNPPQNGGDGTPPPPREDNGKRNDRRFFKNKKKE
jgi:cell fate regulator YaaT (PSP1 superfamily)